MSYTETSANAQASDVENREGDWSRTYRRAVQEECRENRGRWETDLARLDGDFRLNVRDGAMRRGQEKIGERADAATVDHALTVLKDAIDVARPRQKKKLERMIVSAAADTGEGRKTSNPAKLRANLNNVLLCDYVFCRWGSDGASGFCGEAALVYETACRLRAESEYWGRDQRRRGYEAIHRLVPDIARQIGHEGVIREIESLKAELAAKIEEAEKRGERLIDVRLISADEIARKHRLSGNMIFWIARDGRTDHQRAQEKILYRLAAERRGEELLKGWDKPFGVQGYGVRGYDEAPDRPARNPEQVRLRKELRLKQIQASLADHELARELGVSIKTIKRWKANPRGFDHCSERYQQRQATTPEDRRRERDRERKAKKRAQKKATLQPVQAVTRVLSTFLSLVS